MLEFCKKILFKVSFDASLFKKELTKSMNWLEKNDAIKLKIWALTFFSSHKKIILDVFDSIY